jgi:Ni/Fe-hydrogenase subunit HybB-like protein
MRTDTFPPADIRGYADRPVTKAPNWHALIAWDMLFNNFASGSFLVAAIGELVAPTEFRPLVRFAYPAALAFLVADLVCLTLDLGDPSRFHHMLRVFKPSSPMSLGTWCLTAFSFPLAVAAVFAVLPSEGTAAEWSLRIAAIVALVPAAGTALYKGVLFSTTAQPGWRDMRWLGAYMASSTILLGSAGLLVIAIMTGQERAAALLRVTTMLLLPLNAAALAVTAFEARETLRRASGRGRLVSLTAIAIGGGVVLPFWNLTIGWSPATLAAMLLIFAAALLVRFEIVRLPHAAG